MVIYETIEGTDLIRAYSSNGMMLSQDETGILYPEAIDPIYMSRTYTETDIPIEDENFDAEAALNIILGGEQR